MVQFSSVILTVSVKMYQFSSHSMSLANMKEEINQNEHSFAITQVTWHYEPWGILLIQLRIKSKHWRTKVLNSKT
jgi:hypothetical protein